MHKIRIKKSKKFKQYNLPESWEEVPPNLLAFVCKTLIDTEEITARLVILKKLLGLSKRDFNLLDDGQIYDLLNCLDWLTLVNLRIQLFPNFKNNWTLTETNFENGTCYEFAKADSYFKQFQSSQSVDDLNLFFASLARFQNTSSTSSQEIEWRAKQLKRTPLHIKLVTLAYFAGIKSMIDEMFGEYLFKSALDTNPNEYQPRINLEWWGIFYTVAESGVFGDITAVHNYNFLDVCAFLAQKKEQHLSTQPL